MYYGALRELELTKVKRFQESFSASLRDTEDDQYLGSHIYLKHWEHVLNISQDYRYEN